MYSVTACGRKALLQAWADWFECRSPNAVMFALRELGVPFNMIAHSDGTIECWQQPELARWEVPRPGPAEPRPIAPDVAALRWPDDSDRGGVSPVMLLSMTPLPESAD